MKNKAINFILIALFILSFSSVANADDLQLGDIISGPGSASASGGGTTTTVTTDASGQTTTTETTTDSTDTSGGDTFGDSLNGPVINTTGKPLTGDELRRLKRVTGMTDLQMATYMLFGDFVNDPQGFFGIGYKTTQPPVDSRDIQVSSGDIPLSKPEPEENR